jgi:ankyrin repeat protein
MGCDDDLWAHLLKLAKQRVGSAGSIDFEQDGNGIGKNSEKSEFNSIPDLVIATSSSNQTSTPDSVNLVPFNPSLLSTSPSFSNSNKQQHEKAIPEFVYIDPYQDYIHDETNSTTGAYVNLTLDKLLVDDQNQQNVEKHNLLNQELQSAQLKSIHNSASLTNHNVNGNNDFGLVLPTLVKAQSSLPPPPPTHPKPKSPTGERPLSPTSPQMAPDMDLNGDKNGENSKIPKLGREKKKFNLLEKAKNNSQGDQDPQSSPTLDLPQPPPLSETQLVLVQQSVTKRQSTIKPQPLVAHPTSHASYLDTNAQLLTPLFTEPTILVPHTSTQCNNSITNQQNTLSLQQTYSNHRDLSPTRTSGANLGPQPTLILPAPPQHSSSSSNLLISNSTPAQNQDPLCKPGQIKVPIAALCEIVSSIDSVDGNGWTPLLYASFYGNIDCVRLLLTFGANPTFVSPKDGASPLYVALDQHHFAICDLLISVGLSIHHLDPVTKLTPLMFVAKTGNLLSCDYLLRHPARISLNTQTSIEGYTALCYATLHNHINIVDMLLVYKADINVQTHDGYTALMLACNTKNELIAELLISSNAYINTYTHVGITALVCAITQQNYNLVYLLLSKHANPNPMKHRSSITPLIAAVLNNDLTLLQTLVQKYGAIVNTIDYQGRTALMHACTYNSPSDIIKFLMSQGAELNIRDNDGKTSLALANDYGHHHLVRMLFSSGAKRFHLYYKTNEALQLAVININKRVVDKILTDAGNINLHLNMAVIHSVLPRDPSLERYSTTTNPTTSVVVLTMSTTNNNQQQSKQQLKYDLLSKTSNLMDESDYSLLMYCIEKDSMIIGIDYHNLRYVWIFHFLGFGHVFIVCHFFINFVSIFDHYSSLNVFQTFSQPSPKIVQIGMIQHYWIAVSSIISTLRII